MNAIHYSNRTKQNLKMIISINAEKQLIILAYTYINWKTNPQQTWGECLNFITDTSAKSISHTMLPGKIGDITEQLILTTPITVEAAMQEAQGK